MVGHQKEQARDLLLRRLAAEDEHPLARDVELIQRLLHDDVLELAALAHGRLEGGARKAAELDVGRRFGQEGTRLAARAAYELAGELQADDLASTVGGCLEKLDDAREDHSDPARLVLAIEDQIAGGRAAAVHETRKRRVRDGAAQRPLPDGASLAGVPQTRRNMARCNVSHSCALAMAPGARSRRPTLHVTTERYAHDGRTSIRRMAAPFAAFTNVAEPKGGRKTAAVLIPGFGARSPYLWLPRDIAALGPIGAVNRPCSGPKSG